MNFTLGFLTSVLIILPGLAALAAVNLRAGRSGARRPEQPLTSVSALVAALLVSLLVHFLAFWLAAGALQFARAVHTAWPALDLGTALPNPISAFYAALVSDRVMTIDTVVALMALVAFEIAAVVAFTASDAFDLMMDRVDVGAKGWVFQHVTRPAEQGYAPIGHVFTSTMHGEHGIAYKGMIIDIRQGDKGELLAVTLSRPERFLYAIGSFETAPAAPWRRMFGVAPDAEPGSGFVHHPKDYVGGVVSLDAHAISNIVVHNIARSLLREITANGEAEAEAEAAADRGDPAG
jgi:hypothetical protein